MWSENVASRGAQEVASCLLKHLNNNLPDEVEAAILYSDSCGGQNRNIKMSLMLKQFLSMHYTLKTITQKFFVPGHSFNSCDRSFAIIERAKKFTDNIFIPDHWMEMVREAKKNEPFFTVIKMYRGDFFFIK